MKNKILLYGDLNLNIIDGSSIWLISLAKLLARDKNNIVDVLLKFPITKNTIVQELQSINNINFLTADKYIKSNNIVNIKNIKDIIETIDDYRDYSLIIIRGFDVVNEMLDSSIKAKFIPYITDFTKDEKKIASVEIQKLTNIYNAVKNMFVQTSEMKKYLSDVLQVDGKKISVLSPMVFFSKYDNVKIKEKSIVYVGKFAKDWNILELIDIMKQVYNKDKEIKLYVIGEKFNRDIIEQKNYILKKFNQLPNIKYMGALSREKTIQFIQSCELGYNFRSDIIDNDNLLELSTKLLEYCNCQKPVIMRRTKMYENLFGKDYPLFIDNTEEAAEKIVELFNNRKLYKDLEKISSDVAKKFEVEKIYDEIKDVIYSYGQKKLRILVTGHDLKFIDKLFPYIESKYELIVQNPIDYMILNTKESRKLLKSTDIIWCEWMLLNSEWYSNNKLPHQKLFIRAHRFEIEKKYGYKLQMKNVNKIVTVSYHYYEQFIEKFSFPRYKVTVISNYVECELLNKEKNLNSNYNIALIGCLPAKKGLDKAIEILIELKKLNPKYKLFVAGKRPEESPLWNLKEQREYYNNVYKTITANKLIGSVIFTGWVKQSDFLKDILFTLSLTDRDDSESFHLAPMETVASGGIGLILRWKGSEFIYPDYMIYNNKNDIVKRINYLNKNRDELEQVIKDGKQFVFENYDINKIWDFISNLFEIC